MTEIERLRLAAAYWNPDPAYDGLPMPVTRGALRALLAGRDAVLEEAANEILRGDLDSEMRAYALGFAAAIRALKVPA
jgi:hypothetical protein